MGDEKFQRQILRQLKFLNFWITLFGTLLLTALIVGGILLWQVIVFARDTSAKIETFQQQTTEKLDIKTQACDDESLGSFLRSSTRVCE